MDRRAGVVVALVLAACGGAPRGPRVLARGSLAYAVAVDATHLVSVELTEQFELVVRSWPDAALQRRVPLGPPEADVLGLALVPGGAPRAVVGGRDGWVLALALDDGQLVSRWPQGAAITALAATADAVFIGDAGGVVCARALVDGALRVCVDLGAPVVSLRLDGEHLIATTPLDAVVLMPDDLRVEPAPPPTPPWAIDGHVITWRGEAHRFAGAVRGATLTPDGRLLVAAWVTTLDDAAVVLLPAPPQPSTGNLPP